MSRETFTNIIENRDHLPVCDVRNDPLNTDRTGAGFHVHIYIPDEREVDDMNWPVLANYVEEQIYVTLPKRHQKTLLQNKPGVVCIRN